MKTITLVTGNASKLNEYEALLPRHSDIKFATAALDLPEIQSMNLEEIIQDKLVRAYEAVKAPVIVEDISAGLDSLGGLPGPFIKFFEQKLGEDALYKIARTPDDTATIICAIGYYDGVVTTFSVGRLIGRVVAPRGDNGFGFDKVIIPAGETRTMGEMSYEEKNAISHRSLAVKALLEQLN